MTTFLINGEPQYQAEGGPPGVFVPLAEVDALIAALTAEASDALAKQVKDLEELVNYLSDKLQDARQFQANQREVNAILARDCKKAEAERDALRAACESALDWLNNFTIHAPIFFGGEAELASQLNEALARRALENSAT